MELFGINEERNLTSTMALVVLSFFIITMNGVAMECTETERQNLLDFKQGIVDPFHQLSSWHGLNCCDWKGVVCGEYSSHHVVIGLDLSNGRLSGNIGLELFQLEHLQVLDLSHNAFPGIPIPPEMGRLKRLVSLNLTDAGFSGQIPDELGNLWSLRYLEMSVIDQFPYQLRSPRLKRWLKNMTSLEEIRLDGVDLSMENEDWSDVVSSLSNLRRLHMSGCGLSGALSLSLVDQSSLTHLHINFNSITSQIPAWHQNVSSQLLSLDLSYNYLFGAIPSSLILSFQNLQNLDLAGNSDLTGNVSFIIEKASPWLGALDLSYTRIGGVLPSSAIANMSAMRSLLLSETNIQGAIPPSIANLTNLEKLYLSYTGLTGELPNFGMSSGGGRSPYSMTELSIAGNNLEGGIPAGLGNLRKLKLLDLSANNLERSIPSSLGQLSSLAELHLSNNRLSGRIPSSLGGLSSLGWLDLTSNQLSGKIPSSLGHLSSLFELDLNINFLNGTIPPSISRLEKLVKLRLSYNNFEGIVPLSLFDNLTSLTELDLSDNSLSVHISPTWIPKFQLQWLELSSCNIQGYFPEFLSTQYDIWQLDLSNNNIMGTIPNWVWDLQELTYLNLSFNRLEGVLPTKLTPISLQMLDLHNNSLEGALPLPTPGLWALELSNNNLNGSIFPEIIRSAPWMQFLSFSGNNLSGSIPRSICPHGNIMEVLSLSKNHLIDTIPPSIGNCSGLTVLDLSENHLQGAVPKELGKLANLQTLNLHGNDLGGSIPSSFWNSTALEVFDLGNNHMEEVIPKWIGGLSKLRILMLRSNRFHGPIPRGITALQNLQILDLSDNRLSGSLPSNLANLTTMANETQTSGMLRFSTANRVQYLNQITLSMKGQDIAYLKVLTIVKSIDLSNNRFSGPIPEDMGSLKGLIALNLSENALQGRIPKALGGMAQLESLDLSGNKLNGSIPGEFESLTFLAYLNLSNNMLSGRIPRGNQLLTFEASSFLGNPNLCGLPLHNVSCSAASDDGEKEEMDEQEEDGDEMTWWAVAVGLSYGVGFGGVIGVLSFNIAARIKFFRFLDGIILTWFF